MTKWLNSTGKKKNKDNSGVIPQKPHFVPRIPLKDIISATNGFSEENKLGSGGFGDVFRGMSTDGTKWAVKRAKMVTEQTLLNFENEVCTSFLLFNFFVYSASHSNNYFPLFFLSSWTFCRKSPMPMW